MKAILAFALLAFLTPGLFAESFEAGTRTAPDFAVFQATGTEVFQAADATQDIRLQTVSSRGDSENILLLDFENEIPALLKDASGNYSVNDSSYIYTTDARIGHGAALFNRIGNRIAIQSPEELWPGTEETGDFTIEFWINPWYFYRNNVIFKKVGMIEGIKNGLEIYIQDGRVYFSCWNLFQDANDRRHTLSIRSYARIPTKQWSHIRASYRAADGKMVLYINRREEDTAFARSSSGVWQMRFHPLDRSPIYIGDNFSGILDEVRISSASSGNPLPFPSRFAPLTIDDASMRPEQQTGSVVSNVISPASGRKTVSGRFVFHKDEPAGTLLNVYIRYDLKPFRPDISESELPWKRIEDRAEHIPPFAYIQWKAEMKSDPDGKETPILRDIRFDYFPVQAPSAPGNLRFVPELTGDGIICLEWSKSPEEAVQSTGGYYVYYGVRPGEYLGRLDFRLENGSLDRIRYRPGLSVALTPAEREEKESRPEGLRRKLYNKIRLQITNDLIRENMLQQRRGGRPGNFPLIEGNHTYYFTVSAYNEPGSPDQESRQSSEVHVLLRNRPDL